MSSPYEVYQQYLSILSSGKSKKSKQQEVRALLKENGLTKEDLISIVKIAEQNTGGLIPESGEQMMDVGDWIAGMARSATQGLTYGFGDELEAFIRSQIEQKGYEQTLREVQAGLEAFQASNPKSALAAEIAGALFAPGGSLVTGAVRSGLMKAAPKMAGPAREVLTQTGGGAMLSGLYGAGSAQDGERLEGAVEGAASGAAFSGGVSSGLQGVGAAVRAGRKIEGPIGGVFEKIPDFSGGGTGVPPNSNPPSLPGVPPERNYTDRLALQYLIRKAKEEDVTIEELMKRLQAFEATGKAGQTTLADLGAPRGPIQRSMSGLQINDPRAETAIYQQMDARARGASQRGIDDLYDAVLPGRDVSELERILTGSGQYDSLYSMRSAFREQRKEKADKLFDAARYNDEGALNPIRSITFYKTLERAENVPSIRRALRESQQMMLLRGEQMTSQMSVSEFQRFKRYLDDKIRGFRSNGALEQANDLADFRRELLDQVTEEYPVYGQALAVWSGEKALEDAFDLGLKAMSDTKFAGEKIRDAMRSMADDEKTMFRIGLAQSLVDDIKVAGNKTPYVDVAGRMRGKATPSQRRDVLDAALEGIDEDIQRKLMLGLDQEESFLQTFRYFSTGSPTAKRLVDSQNFDAMATQAADAVQNLVTGNKAGLVGQGLSLLRNQTLGRIPGTSANEDRLKGIFGQAVLNRMVNPKGTRQTLQDMRDYQRDLTRVTKGLAPLQYDVIGPTIWD